MDDKIVSLSDKKNALQSAIYHLTKREAFYGRLLQEMTMKFNNEIPTIGMGYNKKLQQFEIHINPNDFLSHTSDERVALFHHEMLHFTNKHIFRMPYATATEEERLQFNIAGDMAINQFIKGLPAGSVDVNDWKMVDGTPFPKLRSMEDYYDLIKEQQKKQKNNPKNKGNVQKLIDAYSENPMDEHPWGDLTEEEEKGMLEEAKNVLKRTIEKSVFGHSVVPDSVKDLLREIEVMSVDLNYKQILRNTVKRTVSTTDREATWKKPNKRYGIYSPGTKLGALPKLAIYIDFSGSISATEANVFRKMMHGFVGAGCRECFLGLWHTKIFYKAKYKLNTELDEDLFESGGTDVTCVLEDIQKSKPDLSVIFTDGYFSQSELNPKSEILWIISENGTENHPMIHLGKTIHIKHLK